MELGSAIAGAASASLGITFLVAAISKIVAGRGLRRTVAAYRIVGDDPDSLGVGAVAAALPAIEFVLAVGAVMFVRERWLLALLGIGLLMAFSAAHVSVIRRREPVECSCFGLTSASRSEPISWRHLVRNVGLAALWIPAVSSVPAGLWSTQGVAAFAVVGLSGLCLAMLLMELPTVLSVAFAPTPQLSEAQGSAI